jgi:HD-GYP domain-containing protein (c-di-GMP phosphodiesterase class II)
MSELPITHPSHLELLTRLATELNSSLHVDVVLNKVIDEVIKTTRAERGFLMLRNRYGTYVFRVARGMNQQSIEDPDFQISRSLVEEVKQKGKAILTSDAQTDERFQTQASVVNLGLRSILCVPLKNEKDGVTGIIYVDNRMETGLFNKADLDLLTAIASNASIAIRNASLYEELENAYEKTLEGWARALELRDQETEEHTKRVVELTLHLARYIGIQGDDLVQIRRGATLHDIGKLGIPDGILLKTDRLTPAEFEFMKFHTHYAHDWIYPIEFLRKAMDIPYCHHEKWDGSGYPRGLQGEEIPLAARIFSVVDVWDALRSNRPYRTEWDKERVIAYIQEQSGTHFDPTVVSKFLKMIEEHPEFI